MTGFEPATQDYSSMVRMTSSPAPTDCIPCLPDTYFQERVKISESERKKASKPDFCNEREYGGTRDYSPMTDPSKTVLRCRMPGP